jgi:hypothetical protein
MSDEQTTERHPSYGLLSIHRVHGGKTNLFGSTVDHSGYLRIRISRAELKRDLHHTWYHDLLPAIVEVDMSPAQYAEAITSPNMGVGTPCTIRYLDGERVPNPERVNPRELFQQEFKKKMAGLASRLESDMARARELLEKKSLTKADRAEIIGALGRVHTEVASNVPFVHSSFDEAMEDTVKEAKAEVESYVTSTILSLGRQAVLESGLRPEMPTLAIADERKPSPDSKG